MSTSPMTILRVDASPRGPLSLSRRLSALFVNALGSSACVIRRDVGRDPPPSLDAVWADAEFVPPADRTPRMHEAMALSDTLVDEVEAADVIVVSTPLYNFSVPAGLKAWFDQIVRMWRTFEFSPAGVQGKLGGKRVVLILTTGMRYGPGSPFAGKDFAEPLVRQIFGFMGVPNVDVVRVEGQLMGGAERDVEKAELELMLLASAILGERERIEAIAEGAIR